MLADQNAGPLRSPISRIHQDGADHLDRESFWILWSLPAEDECSNGESRATSMARH
jgi:hypothetical protein